MGLLTGKTAIVTGAARGIGGDCIEVFCRRSNIAFTDLVIDENVRIQKKKLLRWGKGERLCF